MPVRGTFVQRLNLDTIAREGSPITLNGKTVRAVQRSLELRDREYLAESKVNVGDADWCVFVVSPLAFPPALGALPETAWPPEGATFTWHAVSYTLSAIRPEDCRSVVVALRLIVFRSPVSSSADDDPQTGKRPDYTSPDSTL